MSSFVREMQRKKAEKERIENNEKASKELIKDIKLFGESLDTMFSLDESGHSISVTDKGEFTIYKKPAEEPSTFHSHVYSYIMDYVRPQEVMTLKKFNRKSATLIVGFQLSDSIKEYLRTKHAIHLQTIKALQTIRFTAFERTVKSNDLHEIIVQLLEDFAEQGSKLNALYDKLGGGVGINLSSLRSHTQHINPCTEIFQQTGLQAASLANRQFLARQSGKSSFALQQIKNSMKELEKQASTMITFDTESTFTDWAKKNHKSIYYTRPSMPDIDLDLNKATDYVKGEIRQFLAYSGEGKSKLLSPFKPHVTC